MDINGNAKLNLDTETKGKNFDAALAESRKVWNEELSKIEVSGGSEVQYTKFYTDLWHTLLGRRQIQDVDGSYPDYLSKNGGLGKEGELSIFKIPLNKDGKPKFRHHNSDSWWLSRCSINVLWGLAYPKVLSDVINSQLLYYEHGGHLPRGPIVGRYSAIMTSCGMTDIIVSAYNKGIRDFDIDKAYEAMYKAQTQKGGTCDWSNGKIEEYMQKGYVTEDKPMHVWGGAGRVME